MMNEHYYTRDHVSESRPVSCGFTYRGHDLSFWTDAGVFSRGELDQGTRLLLDALPESMEGDILDLGCGWGPIGISVKAAWPAASVTMSDVNLRALEWSRKNAERNGTPVVCVESDGLSALKDRHYDFILTNPPIRAGKQVIYTMFADAAACLKPGGSLYLVIRKQQGAESCLKYLKTLFSEAERVERDAGFWVLRAVRAGDIS